MPDSDLVSHLAAIRRAALLSQADLAERVGVSRQALSSIEGGKQVPSTLLSLRLARALGCGVEDLFGLSEPEELTAMLAPADLAEAPDDFQPSLLGRRVALGNVDGVWAAHPLSDSGDLAGDALVTGAPSNGAVRVSPLADPRRCETTTLLAGCAPLLGLLASGLAGRSVDARATWISANSRRSLELLRSGLVHVAGLHLSSGPTGLEHESIVRREFTEQEMVVVNLTRWRQGLVVESGNPLGIREAADLLRPDVRVARREAGAGASKLLEEVVRAHGSSIGTLDGPVVRDHRSVARLVEWGAADTGVAIEAVALAAGLDFVPLAEERFDLVLPAGRLAEPHVRRFFDALTDASFRREAAHLPGYDMSSTGDAVTLKVG